MPQTPPKTPPKIDLEPRFVFPADPPPEVSAYFRNKGLKPSFNWHDTWGQEHAFAFTVAKATKADVLGDIRSALQTAIDKGQSLEQFKADLIPSLQKRGWWGRQAMTDPKTGEQVLAQLGSHRRLKVIFEANMRTARAAGQWQRIERTKAVLPYLEYRLGPSVRHRPDHAGLAGTILPVDSSFWSAHFPPNGWGCKCWVAQVGERSVTRKGGVSPEPDIPLEPYENPRTGEVSLIPQGIDPGWHTNPGQLRSRALLGQFHAKLLDNPAVAGVALKDMRDFTPSLLRQDLAELYAASAPGQTFRDGNHRVLSSFSVALQTALEEAGKPATSGLVVLRPNKVNHVFHHSPDKQAAGKVITQDQATRLAEIMTEPKAVYEILSGGVSEGRLMAVFEDAETDTLIQAVLSFAEIRPKQVSGARVKQAFWEVVSLSRTTGHHLKDPKAYKSLW